MRRLRSWRQRAATGMALMVMTVAMNKPKMRRRSGSARKESGRNITGTKATTMGTMISVSAMARALPRWRQAMEKSISSPVSSRRKSDPEPRDGLEHGLLDGIGREQSGLEPGQEAAEERRAQDDADQQFGGQRGLLPAAEEFSRVRARTATARTPAPGRGKYGFHPDSACEDQRPFLDSA